MVPPSPCASPPTHEIKTRPTILIAEDHEALRATLRKILEAGGYYVVIEAEDGEAAREILSGREVDVLVVDLHMPRLDGLSLLEGLQGPPPIVIVLSAFEYVSRESLKKQVGSKLFRVMRKPATPASFLEAVNEATAARQRPAL